MKPFFTSLLTLFGLCTPIVAQTLDDLSFGTENTFDIVTWNIEQFPKNDGTTINYVIDILEALDADVLAIQEVSDVNIFNQMIAELNNYSSYLESEWFGGLAYIYKTSSVSINEFYEIYTTSEYWNYFPRSPMVMDLNYQGERIIVINNHFKCCGDGFLELTNDNDEETRRYFANSLIKEYIDTNFPEEKVIVLGDLNDDLADVSEHNVFQMILDDPENYLFADIDIAYGNSTEWSFPNWPSHLDHILITDELISILAQADSDIQTLKIDTYLGGGWSEYDQNVSDHRPVGMRLLLEESLSTDNNSFPETLVSNYPNPFMNNTNIAFEGILHPDKIDIFDIQGQKIISLVVSKGQTSIEWNAEACSPGIYLAKFSANQKNLGTLKLVKI